MGNENSIAVLFQNSENEEIVNKMFKKYDLSKNGTLSKDEFENFVTDLRLEFEKKELFYLKKGIQNYGKI